MAETQTITYTTPTDYTYDTDLIEVTGGVAKLKDITPVDSTFYADYNTNINANWGVGTTTGSAVGGAAVSGGKLDLSFGDIRYVNYDAIGNADSLSVGCVRLRIIPNYSGIPAVDTQHPFTINASDGDVSNLVTLSHTTGGQINLGIFDSGGAPIIAANMGAWNPISGTTYEWEVNWNLTDLGGGQGATRVFIDGVQLGSTQTQIGTRDANINLFRVGSNFDGTKTSNFKIEDIIVFSKPQHSNNYTPDWSNISATKYSLTNPTIEYNTVVCTDGLISFLETSNISGSDLIKHVLKKDADYYYWNGSAWVVSDETYAQSNTAADINTNAAAFTAVSVEMQLKSFLHSDDGSTTPELDQIVINYLFAGSPPTLSEAVVWGYLYDAEGALSLKTVTVKTSPDTVIAEDAAIFSGDEVSTTTETTGYFEITIKYIGTKPSRLIWNVNGRTIFTNFPKRATVTFSELEII
jgi:hypothetical protein